MNNDQTQSSDYEKVPVRGKTAARMSSSMRVALFVLIVAVYVLHQDFWNGRKTDPMIFGFLPVGLAYHAAYSIAAAALMAVLVKTVWPKHLEKQEPPDQ